MYQYEFCISCKWDTIVYTYSTSTHYPNLSSNSRIIEIIKGHYQIDSIIIYHNNFLSHATELFHKWRDGDGWLMFSTTIMRENGSFSFSLSLNSEPIVVQLSLRPYGSTHRKLSP